MENSKLPQNLTPRRAPTPGLAIPEDVRKKDSQLSKRIEELRKFQNSKGAGSKVTADLLRNHPKIVVEPKFRIGDKEKFHKNMRKTVIDKTLIQPLHSKNESTSADAMIAPRVNFLWTKNQRTNRGDVVKVSMSTNQELPHISPHVEAVATQREMMNPPEEKNWDSNKMFDNGVELAYCLIPVIPKQCEFS